MSGGRDTRRDTSQSCCYWRLWELPGCESHWRQEAGIRCFICLRRGHIGKECRSSLRCRKCGGRHHVSICYQGQQVPTKNAGEQSPSTRPKGPDSNSGKSSLNPTSTPFNPPPTASMYVDSGKTVLLQTAVFNPLNPTLHIEVNLVAVKILMLPNKSVTH